MESPFWSNRDTNIRKNIANFVRETPNHIPMLKIFCKNTGTFQEFQEGTTLLEMLPAFDFERPRLLHARGWIYEGLYDGQRTDNQSVQLPVGLQVGRWYALLRLHQRLRRVQPLDFRQAEHGFDAAAHRLLPVGTACAAG